MNITYNILTTRGLRLLVNRATIYLREFAFKAPRGNRTHGKRQHSEINPTKMIMNKKPVFERVAKTVINFMAKAFEEKKLCDGLTFSLGDLCAYTCSFCYVPGIFARTLAFFRKATGLALSDVVIRRRNAVSILRRQLVDQKGKPRLKNSNDSRVIFTSPLVDPAANMTLVKETALACLQILELTCWRIRILTKSNLLPQLVKLIPCEYYHRLILGVSTGTLCDQTARAFEAGTPLVSKRLESLYVVQDLGIPTFGMICPSLPQVDYDAFSAQAMKAIRADRCQHVWAEVINVRGASLTKTVQSLVRGGCLEEARQLADVCGPGGAAHWEEYARRTFQAHARHAPAGKLRFLQYVSAQTQPWWEQRVNQGAILLGKHAHILSEPLATTPALTLQTRRS